MRIIYRNDRIEKYNATQLTAGKKEAGLVVGVCCAWAPRAAVAGPANFSHRHPYPLRNPILDTFLNWS